MYSEYSWSDSDNFKAPFLLTLKLWTFVVLYIEKPMALYRISERFVRGYNIFVNNMNEHTSRCLFSIMIVKCNWHPDMF